MASLSNMHRFADSVGHRTWPELHRWSVEDLSDFWIETTRFVGTRWASPPATAIAEVSLPSRKWFPEGTMNLTENVFLRAEAPSRPAVISVSQTRHTVVSTWGQLREEVGRCASYLASLGIGRGGRVAACLPNIHETIVLFLATAHLGATWSSCAPEFGPKAVIDRFVQFQPEILFTVDGYRYGRKEIRRSPEDSELIAASLPTVSNHVELDYLSGDGAVWARILKSDGSPQVEHLTYVDPLYVLYSSGTTGLPKPIVHSHVGITVEHLLTHVLHHDLSPESVMMWFTTTGWMMWNYLVSALLAGSTIVLFDGDPMHEGPATLWSVAAEHDVTVFGASPGFYEASRQAGLSVPRGTISQLGSTGSPLSATTHQWLHAAFDGDVAVNSISGGTDVCTAFLGWNPMLVSVPGALAGPILGRNVEAYRPDATPCGLDEQGELVVTTPMPSMPLGFLNDDDGRRYHEAYLGRFPGVWCHGDWLTRDSAGGWVISGRSDATLNRGGVRLGTADFYDVVERDPRVTDSLVVHLDQGRDELLVFVRLSDGVEMSAQLTAELGAALRRELSPRHGPDVVVAVPGIPRTLSGKKLEVPVKGLLMGREASEVASADSLADPGLLTWYADFAAAYLEQTG